MGFLDYLAPAGLAIGQGVAGWQKGQAQAAQQQQDQGLQLLQLMRQKRMDADAEALHQAQISNMDSEAAARLENSRQMAAQRESQNAERADKLKANLRHFGAIKTQFKDSPYAQGDFDPSVDYQEIYKGLSGSARDSEKMKTEHGYRMQEIQAGMRPDKPWQPFPQALGPNNEPLEINTITGETRPISGATRATTGGASKVTGISPQDMKNQLDTIEQSWNGLKLMGGINPTALQAREGLAFGSAADAAKGNPGFQKPLAGFAMDMFGQGTKQKGYNQFAQMQDASRAAASEIVRLMGGRGGNAMMQQQIADLAIKPEDFKNPGNVENKIKRLRTLYEQALSQQGGTVRPVAPTAPTSTTSDRLSKYGIP